MDIGDKYGKKGFLKKKVPTNSKYANVKSKLKNKVGKTVDDVEIISDQLVAKRKNEQFRRIKPSTLVKLLQDQNYSSESIYNLAEEGNEEMKMGGDGAESVYSINTMQTGCSAVTYNTEQLGIKEDTAFLLLDMRDEYDFDQFHIKGSINFPAPQVTRDRIIPELYRFKNKQDKLIIIYMRDEKTGCASAKLLYEKGYDNVFLLSGGIEEFLLKHGDLIEGSNIPDLKGMQEEADKYNKTMLDLQMKKNKAARV